MKNIFIFFASVVLLSSCKAYQLSTIASTDTRIDSTGVFKVENDSLALSYNFKGENEPINIEIYNKLNEPVYVDWAKSALIAADKAYTYANDVINIEGTTSSSSFQYGRRGSTVSDGSISATAKLNPNESFIPPHSKITRTIYVLKNVEMAAPQHAEFRKTFLNYDDGSGQAAAKRVAFDPANTPLTFKSYLTLYTANENKTKTFTMEQQFYVSGMIKTKADPGDLYEFKHNRGDVIVNSSYTGYAKTMAVVGLVGAVGALSTAEAALTDKNKQK
jgi:hypothetical protein